MNWYRKTKIAVPLPEVSNEYPDNSMSIGDIDFYMNQDTKEIMDLERERSFLGHGGYGIAYDTPEGFVEKITYHDKEYDGAKKVMKLQREYGGPLPWVVWVHSVEIIQDAVMTETEYGLSTEIPALYRLVIERVEPLTRRQREWFDLYFWEIYRSEDPHKLISGLQIKENEEGKEEFLRSIADYADICHKFEVPLWDMKGWNVGLRGDDIVLLDIGAAI